MQSAFSLKATIAWPILCPFYCKKESIIPEWQKTKWDTLIHKEINIILSSFLILKSCEIVWIDQERKGHDNNQAVKYIVQLQGSRSWWSYSRPFVDPNLVNADDKRYSIHQRSYKTVLSLLCISLVHILNKQK